MSENVRCSHVDGNGANHGMSLQFTSPELHECAMFMMTNCQ